MLEGVREESAEMYFPCDSFRAEQTCGHQVMGCDSV